jgi:crossover junction endodeoxyribonuclease RuvC
VTGRGAALKPQVGFMVARLLQLSEAPRPADAADGVAVALTHLLLARRPGPVAMRRAR